MSSWDIGNEENGLDTQEREESVGQAEEPQNEQPATDEQPETAKPVEVKRDEIKHFTVLVRGRIRTRGKRGRTLKRAVENSFIVDPHPDVVMEPMEVLLK